MARRKVGLLRLEPRMSGTGSFVVPMAPFYPDASPPPSAPLPPSSSSGDIIGAIERLGQLRDRGIVTDAEFNAKKAELLSRL